MNTLSVSLTEAGRWRASMLPYRHVHGDLAETVRDRWHDTDRFALFCSVGLAVRVIGPLLDSKRRDPAVVCIDETGRRAVVLTGGHHGGNELATEIGGLLGAEPVITTATDLTGVPALDTLPDIVARGDVAFVTRHLLDGANPWIDNPRSWPIPFAPGEGPGRIVVTDTGLEPGSGEVVLHPPTLVVGIGSSSDCPADEGRELLEDALTGAGLSIHSVSLAATIDRRATAPVVVGLGLPVRSFSAETLSRIPVPNPTAAVETEVGTPSVAEAAALLAAGTGAELVVPKTKSGSATVAIARRTRPAGMLSVVGLGPGHPSHRTPAAVAAIRHAEVVIGYGFYVEQCSDLLDPRQTVIRSPISAETERCVEALTRAAAGGRVALVCSGDAGVFAMASLVLELSPRHGSPPVRVVPGVTAALSAASLLGAPLGHDHALISLSDLLTPWSTIERRLEAAAASDLAVALYNPRSRTRTVQLVRAVEIFRRHRPPQTPVGVVTDASRPGQRVIVTTIEGFDPSLVDMLSIVLIGNTNTAVVDGWMVTPRGYRS